jgi:uncharacterized membrane protein YeaQ/YmgE (transglycosylase-associated protein family)
VGILAWIVFGLFAGLLAKSLMPGKARGRFVATVLLGIVGAFMGGFLGTLLGLSDLSWFDLRSMALAVGGAVLVLFLYGLATRGRAQCHKIAQ